MATLSRTVTCEPSWSTVTFQGVRYFTHRRVQPLAGIVIFSVFEPTTIDGPHAQVETHPEFGVLGRVGSQRFPGSPSPQAVGAKERRAQLDSYRAALCVLVKAVLHAAHPDLVGDINPDHCHLEITLH